MEVQQDSSSKLDPLRSAAITLMALISWLLRDGLLGTQWLIFCSWISHLVLGTHTQTRSTSSTQLMLQLNTFQTSCSSS